MSDYSARLAAILARSRKPAPPSPTDYTKTRGYTVWDLSVRTISAIAIVGIGFVTYSLQHHVEDVREHSDSREREERRYLPLLRSNSETAAVLGEISANYGWPKGTESEARAESQLGARLSYTASALQFPDGEPLVTIIPAEDIANDSATPRQVRLKARRAVLLLADIMRLAPLMLDMAHKKATLQAHGAALVFRSDKKTQVLSIDPRTASAWNDWLLDKPMTAQEIYWLDLPTIADDLDRQLTEVNDLVISRHPNLAKDYIEIRADVLRSRSQLVPP